VQFLILRSDRSADLIAGLAPDSHLFAEVPTWRVVRSPIHPKPWLWLSVALFKNGEVRSRATFLATSPVGPPSPFNHTSASGGGALVSLRRQDQGRPAHY